MNNGVNVNEKITLSRINKNMESVIKQINEIISSRNYNAAKEVLTSIAKIVNSKSSRSKVVLDDERYPNKSHMLHELLTNIQRAVISMEIDMEQQEINQNRDFIVIDLDPPIPGEATSEEIEEAVRNFLIKHGVPIGLDGKSEAEVNRAVSYIQLPNGTYQTEVRLHIDKKWKHKFKTKKELEEEKKQQINPETKEEIAKAAEIIHVKSDLFDATERIRAELARRNITSKQLMEWYAAGKETIEKKNAVIKKSIDKLNAIYKPIFIERDANGVENDIFLPLGAPNVPNKEKILLNLFNRCKTFFSNANNFKNKLILSAKQDFEKIANKITSNKEFNKISKSFETFITNLHKNIVDIWQPLYEKKNDNDENINIINDELKKLTAEQKYDKSKKSLLREVNIDTKEEKKFRKSQIYASLGIAVTGADSPEEVAKKARSNAKAILDQRTTRTETITLSDGTSIEVTYQTIDNWDTVSKNAYELNVSKYKEYLELTSIYDELNKTNPEYALEFVLDRLEKDDPYSLDKYNKLKSISAEDAKKYIENYINEKKEYLNTWHGFANKYAVQSEVLKTGGSTLKGFKKVSGDIPTKKKVGNFVENIFRFVGVTKPEFSKTLPNGEKVSTVGQGVLTILKDAGIITGAALAAASGPIGLGTLASAYLVRTGVVLGDVGLSKIIEKRHKEDIENGYPSIDYITPAILEEARKDYYRKQEMKDGKKLTVMGTLKTWARAKADRLPFRKSAREAIHKKIADERVSLMEKDIDKSADIKKKAVEINYEMAKANMSARRSNFRTEALSARTYRSIVKSEDVDSLDRDTLSRGVAINSLLMAAKQEKGEAIDRETSFMVDPATGKMISAKTINSGRYAKNDGEYITTRELMDEPEKGDTVAVTAVTVEERYQAEQRRIDFWNRVATMVGTAAASTVVRNILSDNLTHTVKLPDEIKHEQGEPTTVIKETRLGDMNRDTTDFIDTYHSNTTSSDLQSGSIDSIALRVGDREVSLAIPGRGATTSHVQAYTDLTDFDNISPVQLINEMQSKLPAQYENLVQATGLSNPTPDELFRYLSENNGIYVQTGMNGWNLLHCSTEEIPNIIETVIPGGVQEVVDEEAIVDTLIRGLSAGTLAGATEPYTRTPLSTKGGEGGTFEERNTHTEESKETEKNIEKNKEIQERIKELEEYKKQIKNARKNNRSRRRKWD